MTMTSEGASGLVMGTQIIVQSLKRRQDGHRLMSSSADAVLMKEGIAAKSPVFAAAEIVARDTGETSNILVP